MMRFIRKYIIACCLCFGAVAGHAQSGNYLFNHKLVASVLSEFYGIPTPVILAVAAVESADGNGAVARVLNNHFGIVGDNNFVNNKGHKSRYKQYNNEFESYLDFCQIISRKSFYNRLRNKKDVNAWVAALSRAGYSEQPDEWRKNICSFITTHRR